MRILFVTPYLPYPPDFGGAARMYHLIREVGRQPGYKVVTLSLVADGDDPRPAEATLGRIVPVRVPLTARMPPGAAKRRVQLRSLLSRHSFQDAFYRHPRMQREIERLTGGERFDLVQFEFSQMGRYALPDGLPSLLDVHNVEHDLVRQAAATGSAARRLFNRIEARKFRREEIASWRQASRCLATSTQDAAAIQTAIGRPAEVIPNGVDLERFPRQPLDLGDPTKLVFVGALRYRPNADAAREAAEVILPRIQGQMPGASLALVGADPPAEVIALGERPGVTVSGTVPDVRPWLREAGIVVVPLRSGGGTRLKILEAFALGRPVVSTTVGAAGLEVRDGEHLLLADDPAEFAGAVLRLAADPALRRQLVEHAYSLVRECYQWSAIAARLVEVYERLAKD